MSGDDHADGIAGFSLVEVLVVLAILALAAGFGAPSIRGIVPSHRLNAAMETISGELVLLRTEAVRTGHATKLVFDPDASRFVSSRPGAPVLPMSGWRVSVETGTASRVEAGEIRFLPDGGCTGGRITLAGSGGTRSVVLSRATGAIRRAEMVP